MKKVVFASVLAVTAGAAPLVPAALALDDGQSQGAQQGQTITIKDPAEYNAYTNAMGQSSPAAKAAAIEQFLQQYPNSVVKEDMLEQLMAAYQQTGDVNKTLDAAKRLLAVNPNNVRALFFVAYLEKSTANGDQSKLDDAANKAQTALNAPKPERLSDADYQKLKDTTTPILEDIIGADDVAKKDYKAAIEAYTAELKAYKDPAQTQSG